MTKEKYRHTPVRHKKKSRAYAKNSIKRQQDTKKTRTEAVKLYNFFSFFYNIVQIECHDLY